MEHLHQKKLAMTAIPNPIATNVSMHHIFALQQFFVVVSATDKSNALRFSSSWLLPGLFSLVTISVAVMTLVISDFIGATSGDVRGGCVRNFCCSVACLCVFFSHEKRTRARRLQTVDGQMRICQGDDVLVIDFFYFSRVL
jgi:hypothetical protein